MEATIFGVIAGRQPGQLACHWAKGLTARAMANSLVKIPYFIFMLFCIFTCIIFCPKPMPAKGYSYKATVHPKIGVCKKRVVLKPFIGGQLAVSQFGVRHPKVVSHIVSFMYPNAMATCLLPLSHSGKRDTRFGCLKLSHFCQGFVYSLVYVRSLLPCTRSCPARRLYTCTKQLTMEKRIFGVVLIVLGIIGLVMAGVGFMHSSGGTYSIKSIILYGVLGLVFFSAGVRMITNTADKVT